MRDHHALRPLPSAGRKPASTLRRWSTEGRSSPATGSSTSTSAAPQAKPAASRTLRRVPVDNCSIRLPACPARPNPSTCSARARALQSGQRCACPAHQSTGVCCTAGSPGPSPRGSAQKTPPPHATVRPACGRSASAMIRSSVVLPRPSPPRSSVVPGPMRRSRPTNSGVAAPGGVWRRPRPDHRTGMADGAAVRDGSGDGAVMAGKCGAEKSAYILWQSAAQPARQSPILPLSRPTPAP